MTKTEPPIQALKKHLRYFWLGIANRSFCLCILYWGYCAAPSYFDFSIRIAYWWLGVPFFTIIFFCIYLIGKNKAKTTLPTEKMKR